MTVIAGNLDDTQIQEELQDAQEIGTGQGGAPFNY